MVSQAQPDLRKTAFAVPDLLYCVEGMTTNGLTPAQVQGSWSATTLSKGVNHGQLKKGCDICGPAMKELGMKDAVSISQLPWLHQFQGLLPVGFRSIWDD